MKRPVTIVVLSKYPDVLGPFVQSVKTYCPSTPVVLVRDGYAITPIPGWMLIQGNEKFSMAGNANLGLRAVDPEHDVLYCGDDVRFTQSDTVAEMASVAHNDSRIGLLSAKICGRGSVTQLSPISAPTRCPPVDMWFVCVFVKREVINRVGYFDEQFSDFGSDDLDYCLRCLFAGFSLAVTPNVAVQHISSSKNGPTTFSRTLGDQEWNHQMLASLKKLRTKYQVPASALGRLLVSGDLSFFQSAESSKGRIEKSSGICE